MPELLQLSEFAGAIGVSGVLVAGNLAIFLTLDAYGRRRHGGFLQRLRTHRVPIVLFGACVPAATVYGLLRIRSVDATVQQAPSVSIGLVQANQPAGVQNPESLRRHIDLTKRLPTGLDLVVWSEAALPMPLTELGAPSSLYNLVLSHIPARMIIGAVVMEDSQRGTAQLNSAFVSDALGHVCRTCRYDKQILLPFGEFNPLAPLIASSVAWFPNSGNFIPGEYKEPLRVGNHRVSVSICYEDLHAEHVNRRAAGRASELLVNMTNDIWFAHSKAPYWHFALAKFRAIEQRKFFVRATNSGVSGIIDPAGRVQLALPPDQESVAIASVRWLEGTTVYGRMGNTPWWLFMGASGLLFLRTDGKYRRKSARPKP